jgi:hypothetical protein
MNVEHLVDGNLEKKPKYLENTCPSPSLFILDRR